MKRIILAALLFPVASLAAQRKTTAPPPDTTTRPVVNLGRLSWTSDRRPLRVGDLLTIVVDEQTAASENVSNQAHLTRTQQGKLDTQLAPAKLQSVGIGYDAQSDAGGQTGRSNNLTSVLSVRVTSIEAGGVAKIAGGKQVVVDGRKQDVKLLGTIRSEDVAADNTIASNRIADAVISYQGKKMAPTTGIIGKILAILWP